MPARYTFTPSAGTASAICPRGVITTTLFTNLTTGLPVYLLPRAEEYYSPRTSW